MLHNTRAQGALMRPGEDVAALREILSELLALPEANLRTPEGPTRAARADAVRWGLLLDFSDGQRLSGTAGAGRTG